MSERSEMSSFLKQVLNWDWLEFLIAESSNDYSSEQATVFKLVRTTAESKLNAIKLAIDRVDGPLAKPVHIVYPKVFYLYPHATSVAELPAGFVGDGPTPEEFDEPDVDEDELLETHMLRETLKRMAKTNRQIVPMLLAKKVEIEQMFKANVPHEKIGKAPQVKSVISANLLHLSMEKGDFSAINEVFDQIDGKLAETYHIFDSRTSKDGNFYIVQYADTAPAGAIKNDNGIYMMENKELTEQWKQRFSQK